jgi:hypothetical protein
MGASVPRSVPCRCRSTASGRFERKARIRRRAPHPPCRWCPGDPGDVRLRGAGHSLIRAAGGPPPLFRRRWRVPTIGFDLWPGLVELLPDDGGVALAICQVGDPAALNPASVNAQPVQHRLLMAAFYERGRSVRGSAASRTRVARRLLSAPRRAATHQREGSSMSVVRDERARQAASPPHTQVLEACPACGQDHPWRIEDVVLD